MKIGVRVAGWYRVSQPTLLAAGLDPHVDPTTLRLYLEGVEQPILVTGAVDGQFDPADVVEFYGTGVDTPSSDTAVYFLTGGYRRRAPRADGACREPRTGGSRAILGDGGAEGSQHLLWGAAQRGRGELVRRADLRWIPADVAVTVQHPDSTAPSDAMLEVILQGVTETADPVDHQVRVRVNGTVVGDVTFVGRDQGAATLTVPHGVLLEGANIVQLEALGGAADLSLFDTLRLGYWHTERGRRRQAAADG